MLPLGPSLAALPDLRTLRVTLTSSTLASFAGSIGALSSLTSLDISDSVLVSPEDAVHIAQFAKLQMLRVLVFSELLYCDDVGDALRLTLPQLKALEELQMLNLMVRATFRRRYVLSVQPTIAIVVGATCPVGLHSSGTSPLLRHQPTHLLPYRCRLKPTATPACTGVCPA